MTDENYSIHGHCYPNAKKSARRWFTSRKNEWQYGLQGSYNYSINMEYNLVAPKDTTQHLCDELQKYFRMDKDDFINSPIFKGVKIRIIRLTDMWAVHNMNNPDVLWDVYRLQSGFSEVELLMLDLLKTTFDDVAFPPIKCEKVTSIYKG